MCKMIVMIVTGSIKAIIRIECEGVDNAIKYEPSHFLLRSEWYPQIWQILVGENTKEF